MMNFGSIVRMGEISVVELSDNSLKRVSFINNKIVRLPNCVVQCSNASTLLLQGNPDLDIVPEKFLQGFEALKILNIGGTHNIHSLPLSLLQLGELRALLLKGCVGLKELPSLEELSRLQVLDLSDTGIIKLPKGMENLNNLRQLNLSGTQNLKSIQAGIISWLSCLEVLDVANSSYSFSIKRNVQNQMACFEELKGLVQLLVISIGFKRIPNFSDEDLSFINRLKQFHFFISELSGLYMAYMYTFLPPRRGERAVTIESFNLHSEEVLIGPLLSIANDLTLAECRGLSDMLEDLVIKNVVRFASLKYLIIHSCSGSV
jgi:disease resistance protein RPS2